MRSRSGSKADAMTWWVLVAAVGLLASPCDGGCAEVESLTEAVAGEGFLLGCISCKNREEVAALTTVDWHFKAPEEQHFRHIFRYDHPAADILHEDFGERLQWQGTRNRDVQVGSVFIQNVTFNDTGTYRCTFHRTLLLPQADKRVVVQKEVELTVVAVANRELASIISEIVMYVLIVVLQLWLVAVMVYCYRKIWDEHEARQARRALKAEAALLETNSKSDGVKEES